MKASQSTIAMSYMLSSTLSLSVTGLITGYLANYLVAVDLALIRFLVPAVILFVILTITGLRLPPTSMRKVLAIRAFSIAACQLCFIYALGKLSLIESVVLFGTGPLFIALFEKCLYNIKLTARTITALLFTFIGVIFLTGYPSGFTFKPELVIGLLSGVFNAGSQLSLHRASKGEMSGVENNAWTFLIAGIFLIPFAVIFHQTIGVNYGIRDISTIMYVAIAVLTVMIINTQVFRYKAYKSALTNTQVAPLIYTNLVFAAIFQLTLFDETFTSSQLAGVCLIVVGNGIPAAYPLLKQWYYSHSQKTQTQNASN
ncbi:EamA family transporter [Vibrio sp. SCSIO 43140]|uniref:DMT family transporter n=1 Tax=Vibrio sp. SCSIO 43140 TaxID=2819100 RepID=UPI002074B0AA|nr:DMT family transporter [Vibrio sp. SCSIO 43140]USD63786.1 EamA family transporter [Vibrio sp. SCSIO 43140]